MTLRPRSPFCTLATTTHSPPPPPRLPPPSPSSPKSPFSPWLLLVVLRILRASSRARPNFWPEPQAIVTLLTTPCLATAAALAAATASRRARLLRPSPGATLEAATSDIGPSPSPSALASLRKTSSSVVCEMPHCEDARMRGCEDARRRGGGCGGGGQGYDHTGSCVQGSVGLVMVAGAARR